jgi:hypothetical protein
MDTTTVLKIIEMINRRIKESEDNETQDIDYAVGYELGLKRLRDHLQSFIEGQLDAVL